LTSSWPIRSTRSRALAVRRARGNSGLSATRFEPAVPRERLLYAEGLPTSKRILAVVGGRGVEGKTLLEVGGGIGAIEIELLKAGMARAVNVELTPTTKRLPANC
jgi:magnesium-protoporphyrin O-methyltransferase